MTVPGALYKLIIGPLELLFEFIFALVYRHLPQPGLVIIVLSLSINLLVLPLYRRADRMQTEERNQEARLQHWKDHINKTFKGDERFMMLQTYYRQNNYKPLDALKGSVSLLLEIPFFIAAYNFLSGLRLLNGESFGPIRDLGAPDGLLKIAGLTLNVLPILMTVINFISASIYMRGLSLKTKIQTYGLALIFLFFLYDSPSGLVFYWTMNNVFSLFKNLFYKIKNKEKVLRVAGIILSSAGILVINYLLIRNSAASERTVFLFAAVLLAAWILLLYSLGILKIRPALMPADKNDDRVFLFCGIFLTIFTGILIPSAVIKTSPGDFVNIQSYHSPLWYIVSAGLLAAGTFLIWFHVFYNLASPTVKKALALGMVIISVCSVINYMFFGTKRGDMSGLLIYNSNPADSMKDYLFNFVILAEAVILLYCIWKRKNSLLYGAMVTMSIAVCVMSVMNISDISKGLVEIEKSVQKKNSQIPRIPLSKNGKNVVILMMDRSIGYYIPFLLEEKPELRRLFDGFTFYPNTISYGSTTNEGLPAIYGGYEYTPKKINERTEISLVEKHNEALRMMPSIFGEEGYEVTICDPSYAGYGWIPNLDIYDGMNNVNAYYLKGLFSAPEIQNASIETLNRNFFCFSLYKTAPLMLQPVLYTGGAYNDADVLAGEYASVIPWQKVIDLLTGSGISDDFQQAYGVLTNLPSITEISDSSENTFLALDNVTTHQPTLLQLPDYVPSDKVYNAAFDSIPAVRHSADGRTLEMNIFLQVSHYHINMAAYLTLGKWMDYLRENKVYDNTRIIIVADHGQNQDYDEHNFSKETEHDILSFNPVLMVKDFNSRGFSIDETFMTNADVPTIAMESLIENPVNPVTGVPVTNEAKNESVHEVAGVIVWDVLENQGNTFLPAHQYALHGNDPFDLSSWEVLGEY